MDLLLGAELLLLGACVGFLAGLLGIGGGMLIVPFLTIILANRGVTSDLAFKMAIATSMATILFTALSSVRSHQKRGTVRWDIVRAMTPGITIGGLIAGAGIFALMRGRALELMFVAFLTFSATQMLLDRKPRPSRGLPGWLGQSTAGAGLGLLSGLVGAGGAFASAPYLIWCNVPIHQVVGTASALGFPIALANTAGYLLGSWAMPPPLPGAFGVLYLPALAVIALGSMSAAPWGARTAHALNVSQLKRVFAVLLYGLAGYMLTRG